METIHYVVGVLSLLGGAFLYHQKLREEITHQKIQMLEQKVNMVDIFNHEHADNCLTQLGKINEKLDDLKEVIAQHSTDYNVAQVKLDTIEGKVERLEAWFGKVLEK